MGWMRLCSQKSWRCRPATHNPELRLQAADTAGVSSSLAMSHTVLMWPPMFFDVRERKNPYMRLPIDRSLAQQQWEGLRRSLEEAGVKVETIAPVKDLEDMVFA